MASLTKLSTFNTRLDSLLQGINTSDLSDADRDLAVRHAVREYSEDLPHEDVVEFAGDAGAYYLLYGKAAVVSEAGRDAGIDLASSGANSQLAVSFTLARAMEIHEARLWLSRTGATVTGTLTAAIYTDSSDLPGMPVVSSQAVDLDGVEGAPRGRYAPVRFYFETIYELPAGTYHVVLSSSGYTYADGSAEVILGVDQSSVTNTVSTYDGSTWTAYGTDSAGILEVIAGTPGWRAEGATVALVEYPAAAVASDEVPQMLDDEEFSEFETADGTWLRFINKEPASTDTVRAWIHRPYEWTEGSDPLIDTPAVHFEAICNLAAGIACEWLATRYGQKRASTIAADVVERRTQADVYLSLANRFRKAYAMLAGVGEGKGVQAGQALVDVDYAYAPESDFLFHNRRRR